MTVAELIEKLKEIPQDYDFLIELDFDMETSAHLKIENDKSCWLSDLELIEDKINKQVILLTHHSTRLKCKTFPQFLKTSQSDETKVGASQKKDVSEASQKAEQLLRRINGLMERVGS